MRFLNTLQKLLLCCLFMSGSLFAETQLELMYSASNPDYKPYKSTSGTAISGQFDFSNGLFLSGYFNETDFPGSGPKVRQFNVESWTEVGVGYTFDHEWGEFYSLITIESVDTQTKTFDGYGAHFGYRNQFSEQLTGVIQLGHIDTDFGDWQLIGKLYYQVSDNIALTLGIRDYDSWDYTNYETGIVFRF